MKVQGVWGATETRIERYMGVCDNKKNLVTVGRTRTDLVNKKHAADENVLTLKSKNVLTFLHKKLD